MGLTVNEERVLLNAPEGAEYYVCLHGDIKSFYATRKSTGMGYFYTAVTYPMGMTAVDCRIRKAVLLADLRKQGKTVVDAELEEVAKALYEKMKPRSNSCSWDCLFDSSKDVYVKMASANKVEPVKPRTKVEYVKVEFDHIWEGIKAMEVGGETYFVDGNEDVQYIEIGNVPAFMRPLAMKEAIYRKVETEITWQDEVREFIAGCEEISVNTSFTEVLTYGYLNGELTKEACNDDSQIAFVDEFIEMCNLVTSLTK